MDKKYVTLGCCGLDCGLCPRFYTKGNSKCPGCYGSNFFDKHPLCSFITCCVKKKNLEVCAEYNKFPCPKFDKETGEMDSFITHRRVMTNQKLIKKDGLNDFIEKQKKRIEILNYMIENYDNGRCKNFYCIASTLLSIESLNKSIKEAETTIKLNSIAQNDLKNKAKLLKEILNRYDGRK